MTGALDYRPWSASSRVLMTLLFTLAVGLMVFLAAVGSRDVTVDAAHDTGLLVVTKTYPLAGAWRDTYALAAITGTEIRTSYNKGQTKYALALQLESGRALISSTYSNHPRAGQKRALDAFLADPGAAPLHLAYDHGSPAALLALAFAGFILYLLRTVWLVATVRVEGWRDTLILERARWPLGRWSRSFRLGEIRRAEVVDKAQRRGTVYRVVLALASGEEVPLLNAWGNAPAMQQEAADWINGAIGRS